MFTAMQSEGSVAMHGAISQDSQLLDAQSSSMLRRWVGTFKLEAGTGYDEDHVPLQSEG